MKKLFFLGIMLFSAMCTFIGCELNAKLTKASDNAGGGTVSEVSFDNFTDKRSVTVDNNSSQRLVAFKSEISAETLISGVPAGAKGHGLKFDSKLFPHSQDFALRFITEADYNKYKNNLDAIKNTPFASIYAFYNDTGNNDNIYIISRSAGGNERLILNNASAFTVELRNNSPTGEVLGYIAPHTSNTVLRLESGNYTIFPVFKKYMKKDNEIYSVFPRNKTDGKLIYDELALNGKPLTWDIGDYWKNVSMDLSSGGCYVTINNSSSKGVRFSNGMTENTINSLGISIVNAGEQAVFFIPFAKQVDNTYPAEMKFGALKLGGSQNKQKIPEVTLKCNYKYVIDVTGEEYGALTINLDTQKGQPVDINKIYDIN